MPAGDPLGYGTGFPLKIALTIAVIAVVLAGARFVGIPNLGLDLSAFQEVVHLRWPAPPAAPVPTAPVVAQSKPGQKPPPVSAVFADDSNALDPFFAALWKLEQAKSGQIPAASSSVVTVLHYGDSPTTADLITGDMRAALQERFGDAGRGYTLISKPWPWYGHRGIEVSGHGWRIKTGVGLMREGIYGLGGASFEGEPGAVRAIRLTEGRPTFGRNRISCETRRWQLYCQADGAELWRSNPRRRQQAARTVHVALPPGTNPVSIQPTVGIVDSLWRGFPHGLRRVLYDSLGFNGATTSVLARVLEPNLWQEELNTPRPR